MTATLQVLRYSSTDTDAHNNPVGEYSDPQDWIVRGYAPGANLEVNDLHRDASLIVWTVYADATDDIPSELDRVILGGDQYAVEGRPSDWTNGPWDNPFAGIAVELRRVEG